MVHHQRIKLSLLLLWLPLQLFSQTNPTVAVLDFQGRGISHQEASYKSVHWDGTNDQGQAVSAGMYPYQIKAGNFVETKKMVV